MRWVERTGKDPAVRHDGVLRDADAVQDDLLHGPADSLDRQGGQAHALADERRQLGHATQERLVDLAPARGDCGPRLGPETGLVLGAASEVHEHVGQDSGLSASGRQVEGEC